MEATEGEDLNSQLIALRRQIEELERENERLRLQISACRCSKEQKSNFGTSDFSSSNRTSQSGSKCNVLHPNEITKPANKSSSLSSPTTLAKEPFNCLCLEKPIEFAKLRLNQPGCQPRDFQPCAKRYVALKIMYFGKRFYGFASEAQIDPTIESEVFKALERTKLLVGNKAESHYSRCGRTDKGVSSTGQVISLYLRSNLKVNGGNPKKQEIDYVKVLNKALPQDIRVIGWSPVSTDFSASIGGRSMKSFATSSSLINCHG